MSRKLLLSHAQTHSSHQPVDIIIASYEGGIYQAFMVKGKTQVLIWKDEKNTLKAHSLGEMRELLESVNIASLSLKQDSAYDEMIGQQQRVEDNTLFVPLENTHSDSDARRSA